jgi:hypothetical protein
MQDRNGRQSLVPCRSTQNIPEEIEVVYYTTPRQPLDDYATATSEQLQERLSQSRFRKTWFIRTGYAPWEVLQGTTSTPVVPVIFERKKTGIRDFCYK